MKVEDLKNLGLDDEVIKKVQALSGADVTAEKTKAQSQIDSLNTQITDLQGQVSKRDSDIKDITTQLEAAGQSATKLSDVQKAMNELQNRYTQETQAYQTKLADQKYEFLVRERASAVNFSCKAAKNEFIANLMKNRLPVNDNAILGFDDYLNQQREADPDAFKQEIADPGAGKPNPQFAPPPNPNNNQGDTSPKDVDFGFNFIGVRKHD